MSFFLQTFLSELLNVGVKQIETIDGGCINETYGVRTSDGDFFCKTNSASKFPHLFEKEKHGLELLAKQKIIRVPNVINCSEKDDQQILILEWIKEGRKTNQFWKTFGKQLAALHLVTSDKFGLEEDNYMGSVTQLNFEQINWTEFFISQRLQPLIKLCQHYLTLKHFHHFEVLYKRLPEIFNEEKPSLLHGDLWSGNFMCDETQSPVLIDPAVYFGHRSVDLAMTTLFGGFHSLFYESYHYYFPLPDNYKEQWKSCNLYPLLIHLFLFGRSYLSQIEQTLEEFV
jgi:protein-ribulosamine 3-kinase